MADENIPASPQLSSAVQPEPSPGGAVPAGVTTAPAPTNAEPQETTPFSLVDYGKGTLRAAFHCLVGAVVGAVAGLLFDGLLFVWTSGGGDIKLVTGAGLLLGVFFNRYIVQTLGLAPKKEPDVRTAAAKTQADGPPPDSFREVVETVVFVVVLVLMLKSFAAEAFVIPTGSMSETLLGYQKMTVCPQCGYRFPVNCSQEVDPSDSQHPEHISGCTCPNCRLHISYADPAKTNLRPDEVSDPPNYSGDRVLVAKFLYDLFGKAPDRLDVVVFKFPGGGQTPFPLSGPYKDGVPMNYIKRLVGLSGETIAIHNGNLYALPAPTQEMEEAIEKKLTAELKRPPTPDEKHDEMLKSNGLLSYYDLEREPDPVQREELAKELWEKRYLHVQTNESDEAVKEFHKGAFQIIRKSPDNILAMRRIVYDNDHPAKDLLGIQPPRWADRAVYAGAWAPDGKNGFKLTPGDDDQVHWLSYRHLLRNGRLEETAKRQLADQLKREPTEDEVRKRLVERYGDERPELVTDFMGYNTWENATPTRQTTHSAPGENWVGDLILEGEVQLDKPQGELTLELSKGVDRFRARWDLATGFCTLLRVQGDKEEKLDSKPTGLKGGGSHHVRFSNVDQRLTVWVDEALPFGDGVVYLPAETEGPTKENDLEPASVGLKGTGAALHGLKLYRDTYYTTGISGRDNPGLSDVSGVEPADPTTWSGMRKPPTKTIYVQPGHYLCMGDNSPESSDGRTWGLVPSRLLLGKALAVYYPFDRFGRIR